MPKHTLTHERNEQTKSLENEIVQRGIAESKAQARREAIRDYCTKYGIPTEQLIEKEEQTPQTNPKLPSTKIQQMKAVLSIIQELAKKTNCVSYSEIFAEAEKISLDENFTRMIIDELNAQGDIIKPKTGFVKLA